MMVVRCSHGFQLHASDTLHRLSSYSAVDCGNYIFRCEQGCIICPLCGKLDKNLKVLAE